MRHIYPYLVTLFIVLVSCVGNSQSSSISTPTKVILNGDSELSQKIGKTTVRAIIGTSKIDIG